MVKLRITEKESKQISRRKGLKEAESYGWEVPDDMANEAYEFACEYFGKDEMNQQIINCISNEELASCLAFLFRNWDFREWDEYLEGNDEEVFDESLKESKENTTYVVFRKYYNEYTDTYEPIAFYWGNDIPATYGRINITEQDGNIPYMKTPRYVHDEADINYIAKTKKLTPNDECYDDFTKFVLDELGEDGYNVIVKQKVDYNVVRDSWRR